MPSGPTDLAPEEFAHLDRARALARRGWGHVHPNPLVGCVLVRDGAVVGEGYHAHFGGPHAEIAALEDARSAAEGATAYVTLEPCSHHGKTPPCSDALARAGIARLVYGAAEPGEEAGGGADALARTGIEVVGPVWSRDEARSENPVFFHAARHRTPFLALKLAMSLDARIAAGAGKRTHLTGPEADREVHRLRSGFDAVMVGAGTVRADDPRLTVRLVQKGDRPLRRVVLDPDASTPSEAALFAEGVDGSPVHIFTREDASEAEIERLEACGAHVHPVRGAGGGLLALDHVTEVLWEIGARSIFCEGGRRLAGRLLAEDRVHRLLLFVAPTTLGADGLPAFEGDADRLDWSSFDPVAPAGYGRDALLVFDRKGH